MSAPRITAVILTLNEEEHLPECLDSLADLCSRIVVLDSGSTDGTAEIARAHGAEVAHSSFHGYASQRNEGLRLAVNADWVLFIDADERLTPECRAEIAERLSASHGDIAGFWLPRKNVAFGRVLRGGGWWPDYQARVIRRGRGRYDTAREVHEVVQFDGSTVRLCNPFIHLNYATRREFMRKQRAYTLRHVQHASQAAPRLRGYVGRPVREFWRRFVALKGYRDGVDGFFMATVMALEQIRGCVLLRRREAG